MNGVVLRCRTCGTPQDHAGDCDACAAGPVAYFCGNHSPGLWLEGPDCHACGASFGDAHATRVAPSSPTSPSIPRSPTRPSTSARPTSPPTRTASPGVRRVPRPAAPPPPGRVTDADDTEPPSLADLLVEMAEEGRRRGAAIETPPVLPTAPRVGASILGCLFRLVLVLVVLGLLALAAVSMLVNTTF